MRSLTVFYNCISYPITEVEWLYLIFLPPCRYHNFGSLAHLFHSVCLHLLAVWFSRPSSIYWRFVGVFIFSMWVPHSEIALCTSVLRFDSLWMPLPPTPSVEAYLYILFWAWIISVGGLSKHHSFPVLFPAPSFCLGSVFAPGPSTCPDVAPYFSQRDLCRPHWLGF